MENQEKKQIAEALENYCARFESQNKAAHSLKGVSAATITQVLQGNWDLIADRMWRNIASQIGFSKQEWVAVETENYKLLVDLLEDAQQYSNVYAVCGEAGSGKTFTIRQFGVENKRVYMLQCNEYWNRKMFMQELLTAMGRDCSGYTVGEMMSEVVRGLKKEDHPLIVMDEADKLTDQVMYFFITLYNQLEDHCGIVMCATDHLQKRIKRGLKLNKKGYKEIFSRIGRKFVELDGVSSSDIVAICINNGITDKGTIKGIIEDCEWDLRRVKRKIHALKQLSQGI